jgi:hypothetical protein
MHSNKKFLPNKSNNSNYNDSSEIENFIPDIQSAIENALLQNYNNKYKSFFIFKILCCFFLVTLLLLSNLLMSLNIYFINSNEIGYFKNTNETINSSIYINFKWNVRDFDILTLKNNHISLHNLKLITSDKYEMNMRVLDLYYDITDIKKFIHFYKRENIKIYLDNKIYAYLYEKTKLKNATYIKTNKLLISYFDDIIHSIKSNGFKITKIRRGNVYISKNIKMADIISYTKKIKNSNVSKNDNKILIENTDDDEMDGDIIFNGEVGINNETFLENRFKDIDNETASNQIANMTNTYGWDFFTNF